MYVLDHHRNLIAYLPVMTLSVGPITSLIPRLLLSIAVSVALLGILIHFTLSSAEPAVWASLVSILLSFSAVYVLLYLVGSLVRTLLQALRYRALLLAAETEIPSLFHVFLVTLSRNMFVDMLPARLGELSYIAMLNRGYRVSGGACVSSLVISFVFDLIALAALLIVLMGVQIIGGNFQDWMAGVLIMLALLIGFLLLLLYPAFGLVNRLIDRIGWLSRGIAGKGAALLKKIEQALVDTRRAGITGRILMLSLGVRLAKYFGLYCLFIGVVAAYGPQDPEMDTAIATVLPALVSAEAGASLPVPAFMGFGTYEAGGTLALVALGASKATSLIVMLAMHVISQIVDYLLGGLGLILFIFKAKTPASPASALQGKPWKIWLVLAALLVFGAALLLYEMRAVKKRGSVRQPDQGQAVLPADGLGSQPLSRLDGFVVWSSNRSGNHDIWLKSFPDGTTRQLTTHPHTEYYPRVSPDGKWIVFARSHEVWVSQRNVYAWDVWLLDLQSGREQLLAKNGNVPTWSRDGKKVYFQRNANQVVELDLKSMAERVVYQSGVTVQVPPKTELQTPSISGDGRLAVTFRQALRATAVVEKDGAVRQTGNGCQLTWGPDDAYLVKVDHGGRMQNAIYQINPDSLESRIWFDAPEPYSHEYFPMVANTGDVLVYGASAGGHEHDTADYEIFLWLIGTPESEAVRITHHTGNDCWPDVFLHRKVKR